MSYIKTGHLPDGIRVAALGSLALIFANSMDSSQVNEIASLIITARDDVAGGSKAESKIWSETIARLARIGSISKLAEVQRYSSARLSSCDLALHLLELTLSQESLPFKALSDIVKWSFGAEESELHTYLVNNMRQQDGSDFLVAVMATSSPENTIDIYFARLTISNMSAEPARNSKEGLIYVDELSIPMDLLATNGKCDR